ncbi:uncharacterized protein BO97DRAFT_284202 [Aspergillus homomorphus CBS 101889]|uniref:Uncharacterized protein n=1 Tax=Aspergillus homomorphus (strain CBS 101889) TaxID=1450537 RepID=A0A395I2H0_ASPHC|nr:hypothetical protein BO97DRAFT_284202 [Aspergillus homomorphus CBS 101889]RAL14372.1 hypothetical protein BO97DRAFT_284202 [Aspergillus homomorphus CBS 101889]
MAHPQANLSPVTTGRGETQRKERGKGNCKREGRDVIHVGCNAHDVSASSFPSAVSLSSFHLVPGRRPSGSVFLLYSSSVTSASILRPRPGPRPRPRPDPYRKSRVRCGAIT